MEKSKKEKFEKKYPKIFVKHQRIDFMLLDQIINFVKKHPKIDYGISVKNISGELKVNPSKVRNYCLKYAIPFGELNIHKKGNSYQYPVSISLSGAYKSIKDFDQELEESCSLIIDFFNQNPTKLPKNMENVLRNLKISLRKGKPNIGAQEKLIKILWRRNIEVNCLTFRKTNYLFC